MVGDIADELVAHVLHAPGLGAGVVDQGIIVVAGVEGAQGQACLDRLQPGAAGGDAVQRRLPLAAQLREGAAQVGG